MPGAPLILSGKRREEMMSSKFKDYSFTTKRYGAKQPNLANGVESKRHRVASAPLAVALGLANYGVGSVLIEANDSVCFDSRAI
jgi:3-(3-hydroxy-phenyl)propionate hydroxylase